MKSIFIFLILITNLFSITNKEFTLYKKDSNQKAHTLLIIGGIHGDEPGGYFAPAFFEKYYKIKKGSVWVIPSVNINSMIANTRGLYKDMNRKFSTIDKKDPDFKNIETIKSLILNKDVDLILNLHDGHGFYREKYENSIFNPGAWGQATIIDQEKIHSLEKFGHLDQIASTVRDNLNSDKLFKDFHTFSVKNTETKMKDEQQQLSLTFFAVTNNKPAFAIETSKNITDLTQKVIYQLKSIEEFMRIMDIEFERDFDLNNYEDVKKLIYNFGTLKINDNTLLNLDDIKKNLKFIPLMKTKNTFTFEHTLGHSKFKNNSYEIYIGNFLVTTLSPQYFEQQSFLQEIEIELDGKIIKSKFGQILEAQKSFNILDSSFRVNVIGFSKPGVESEDNILLTKNDMVKNFSIDNSSTEYRVEFYKENKFIGMITIKFIR